MLFARALVRVSRSRLNGLTDLSIIKEALEKSPCTNTLYIFSSFDIVDRVRIFSLLLVETTPEIEK